MRVLLISNLYPNCKELTRGIYNKQQIAELARLCDVQVVAPLPWYRMKGVPRSEVADGIQVYHPPYFMIPRIGRSLYGFFFFLSLIGVIKKIQSDFDFDLILANWAYPDGVGSYYIGKALRKKVVIGVLGTDINNYSKFFIRRNIIGHALRHCDAVFAVSDDLKRKVATLGVPDSNIFVVRNGINKDIFNQLNKAECRKRIGLPLDKTIVLFVGNLVEVKSVETLVGAFAGLRVDALLVLVGDGPLEETLRAKVKDLGIEDRVIFAGRNTHDAIPIYMNACDIFCLPSRNEGCPNVVLEAMACGVPIVATNVGGIPELVNDSKLGILVAPENSRSLADALIKAFDRQWDYDAIARHGSQFTWAENAQKLFHMLSVVSTSNSK